MSKLFVVEVRKTYVIEAADYDEAFEELSDIDRIDSYVWENEQMSEATPENTSRHWANLSPSNKHDGRKLKDISPKLFRESV
jgi:hypothetical protein